MTIEEILNTDQFSPLPQLAVQYYKPDEVPQANQQDLSQQQDRLPNISTLLRATDVNLEIIEDQAIVSPAIVSIQTSSAAAEEIPQQPPKKKSKIEIRRIPKDPVIIDFGIINEDESPKTLTPILETKIVQPTISKTPEVLPSTSKTKSVQPTISKKSYVLPSKSKTRNVQPTTLKTFNVLPSKSKTRNVQPATSTPDIQPAMMDFQPDIQPTFLETLDVQPATLTPDIQPTMMDVQHTTSATSVLISTSEASIIPSTTATSILPSTELILPSTSASAGLNTATAEGTVTILDFTTNKLPRKLYTEFYDIFEVEQPNPLINKKDYEKSVVDFTNYKNRKLKNKTTRDDILKAKNRGYVLAPDGVTQFTIKAYHGVKRGERGGVYQVAVQFSDNTIRWVNKNEIKKNSSESLQLYFDKVNTPNPEINPAGLKLF